MVVLSLLVYNVVEKQIYGMRKLQTVSHVDCLACKIFELRNLHNQNESLHVFALPDLLLSALHLSGI